MPSRYLLSQALSLAYEAEKRLLEEGRPEYREDEPRGGDDGKWKAEPGWRKTEPGKGGRGTGPKAKGGEISRRGSPKPPSGQMAFPDPGESESEYSSPKPREEAPEKSYIPHNEYLSHSGVKQKLHNIRILGNDTDWKKPGPYGKTIGGGQPIEILGSFTPMQHDIISNALTYIPDVIKERIKKLSIRIRSVEEMTTITGEDERMTAGLFVPTDYIKAEYGDQLWINGDVFRNAGDPKYMNGDTMMKGMMATVFHEVGHSVQYHVTSEGPPISPYRLGKYTKSDYNFYSWAKSKEGIAFMEEAMEASVYAASEPREAFAEAFANILANPKSTLGPATESYMKRLGFNR